VSTLATWATTVGLTVTAAAATESVVRLARQYYTAKRAMTELRITERLIVRHKRFRDPADGSELSLEAAERIVGDYISRHGEPGHEDPTTASRQGPVAR
jgi:hypothetical protein